MGTWAETVRISRGTVSKITPLPPLSLDFWSTYIESAELASLITRVMGLFLELTFLGP